MDSIQKASPKPSDLMEVFFSYAHEDEVLRDELAKHLKLLERQGVIKAWSDRNITAGEEWKNAIDERLESANIILLLISADFLASDYCYDIELDRALERHKSKAARVIPIILRSSDWQNSAFGKLAALPTGGKAITSWPNEDEAFTDVVQGIRKAIDRFQNATNIVGKGGSNLDDFSQPKRIVRLFGIDISFTKKAIIVTCTFFLVTITFFLNLQPKGFLKAKAPIFSQEIIDDIASLPTTDSSTGVPESTIGKMKKDEMKATSEQMSSSVISESRLKPRVWLLAGTNSKIKTFNKLKVELKKMGVEIYTTREKPVGDEGRPDEPEIRYYNDSDRKESERIAKIVQSILSKPMIKAEHHNDESGTEGYIELWLGR
jgi:hypothetical protein